MKCRCGNDRTDCAKLIMRLHELDFAIGEVTLYLDMYPDCAKALDYYHRLIDARNETVALYEETCGPLTQNGNLHSTVWQWTDGPMPWESDAN